MARFANAPLREKLKDRQGLINLTKQVAFDNFIHYTFIYFPVFYVLKEAIQVAAPIVIHADPHMCMSYAFSCIQGKDHDGTPWGILSGGMNKVNVCFCVL